jgi:hypothetical protein
MKTILVCFRSEHELEIFRQEKHWTRFNQATNVGTTEDGIYKLAVVRGLNDVEKLRGASYQEIYDQRVDSDLRIEIAVLLRRPLVRDKRPIPDLNPTW